MTIFFFRWSSCVSELFNRAHCRCNGENAMAGFAESAMQFAECCGFAGSGGTTDIDREVTRVQNELNCVALIGTKRARRSDSCVPAETRETANPAIDEFNHLPLALETLGGCDFAAVSENR